MYLAGQLVQAVFNPSLEQAGPFYINYKLFLLTQTIITVKKLLTLVIVLTTLMLSCKVQGNNQNQPVATIISENADKEGRPMFTVKLPNGKTLEHMYAEEIAQGLLDGKWIYDEAMTLVPESCYQVTLEQDSIHIVDRDRPVAVVSYKQIGILDSIFTKDNE